MAEEVKDVILHVYKLAPQDNSFVSRFLPAIGFGAYHSCLEVDGYRYTFAANVGIQKMRSNGRVLLVPGAQFEESVFLGGVQFNRGEVNGIVKKLEEHYFGSNAYHLVYRNCNHFSETFATALIVPDKLIESQRQQRLKTYPDYINRLANTSRSIVKSAIDNKDDIVPCNAWEEARLVIGVEGKVGWNMTTSSTQVSNKKSNNQKKELTEEQKAILAKIRVGKK